jgi:hypothetical protein
MLFFVCRLLSFFRQWNPLTKFHNDIQYYSEVLLYNLFPMIVDAVDRTWTRLSVSIKIPG